MKSSLLVLLCAGLFSTICLAGEWRQFRGPDGQGRVTAKNLPVTWSETENVAWKTAIPGKGWSSPVYASGKIWVTSAVEKTFPAEEIDKVRAKKLAQNPMAKEMSLVDSVTLHAVSVDAVSGKVLSDTALATVSDPPEIHKTNSFASPTPVLDEKLLFCHFGEQGTFCLNTDTHQVVWRKTLPAAYSVGAGSSPIVYGDLLIVPCDGTDQQYVIALNKQTGEQVWKTRRPTMAGTVVDFHKSYSSPLVIRVKDQDQLVIPAAQWFVAYEPLTGKELWRFRHGDGFSNSSLPVATGDLVCITSGFMKPQLHAIRLAGATGDVTQSHEAWKISKQVPIVSSPVIVGDAIYYVNDQGIASCASMADGKIIWTKRIGGNYSASPIYADNKIYFCSHEGKTTVIAPGADYQELAVNSLDGQLNASPVVLDESLILRTPTHLYRIGKNKPTQSAAR